MKLILLNTIATKLNLLKYAPRTTQNDLIKKWADEGIEALMELRKQIQKDEK